MGARRPLTPSCGAVLPRVPGRALLGWGSREGCKNRRGQPQLFLVFCSSRALLDSVCLSPGFPAHNTFWFHLAIVIVVSVALYVSVYVVLVSLRSIVFYVGDMPVCGEIVLMIRRRV